MNKNWLAIWIFIMLASLPSYSFGANGDKLINIEGDGDLPVYQVGKSIPLLYYLQIMGDRFDVYFTVESWRGKVRGTPLIESNTIIYEIPSNIKELREKLSDSMPDSDVTLSLKNPQVVKIIDKRFRDMPEYPMGKFATFEYHGPVWKLPEAVGKNVKQIIRFGDSYGLPVLDNHDYTVLQFNAVNQDVREILTTYLPLSQYNRVLWNADSMVTPEGQVIEIKFYGPRVHEQEGELTPFDTGLLAYLKNSATELAVGDAIKFIDGRMQETTPTQVRWAMLWLGKHKVLRGVPTLIKYLAYEYAPVDLLSERFPALKALIQIGDSKSLLEALKKETLPIRLQLLCRTIIGIQGSVLGVKSLQEVAESIPDTHQRQLLQDAIREAAKPKAEATLAARN